MSDALDFGSSWVERQYLRGSSLMDISIAGSFGHTVVLCIPNLKYNDFYGGNSLVSSTIRLLCRQQISSWLMDCKTKWKNLKLRILSSNDI